MYPDYLAEFAERGRTDPPRRLELALSGQPVYPPMNADERKDVLTKYHPDFSPGAKRPVRVGPNAARISPPRSPTSWKRIR